MCAPSDAVRQIEVCVTMGGQAGGWADGLPSFLRPDNHSRPLSAILGYKLFPSSPPCVCVCVYVQGKAEGGWQGHGYTMWVEVGV